MVDIDGARNQVNDSGFPFQLRVMHDVAASQGKHLWRPLIGEHRWQHARTGEEGFIDIVLEKQFGALPNSYIVVECKRLSNGRLVFLTTLSEEKTLTAHVLQLKIAKGGSRETLWIKKQFHPETFVCQFCVVPGQRDGQVPSLERISTNLLDSVEGVAVQQTEPRPGETQYFGSYLPVIVTNAELVVCRVDPAQVDVTTGELGKDAGEFTAVPYVRLRKAFATLFGTDTAPTTLREMDTENQRTIFVVNAGSLPDFLVQWHPD
jgi:hypothetical protein